MDAELQLFVDSDAEHRPAVARSGLFAATGRSSPASTRSSATRSSSNAYTSSLLVRHAAHDLRLQPRQPVHDQLGAQRFSRAGHRRPTCATGVEQERIYAQTYQHRGRLDAVVHAAVARPEQVQPHAVGVASPTWTAGAFWIRNERTGGEWVHQTKRPTFGLSRVADAVRAVRRHSGRSRASGTPSQPTIGYSLRAARPR